MKQTATFLGIFLVSFLFSCTEMTKTQLPTVEGKSGEVLLLMEEATWKSSCGNAFKDMLMSEVEMLPQGEPLFDVVQIPHKAFEKMFKVHRSIVNVRINSTFKTPAIVVKRNVWARSQTYIEITAPSDTALLRLVTENQERIRNILLDSERKRNMDYYAMNEDISVRQRLEKRYNISMIFPKGYTVAVEHDDFAWVSFETSRLTQAILVFNYDYRDTLDLTMESMLAMHNVFLKENVPGPVDSSYMAIEQRVEPIFQEIKLNEKYAAEMRGLWKTVGDFMGGPFMSVSVVDEKNGRIITAYGFLYAGKQDKRNYMRQIESILYTLKLNNN